jgi:hypothetical protein
MTFEDFKIPSLGKGALIGLAFTESVQLRRLPPHLKHPPSQPIDNLLKAKFNLVKILKEAIASRKPVRFKYKKTGKAPGVRIGNPHVLFIMKKKDGTQSVRLDLVQTAGITDSPDEPFPQWKNFDLLDLGAVSIVSDSLPFTPSDDYNRDSERYAFSVAKV